MSILDMASKLFGKSGKNKIGDLGLEVIIEQLQKLGAGADEGDQKNLTDIIAIIKKALADKGDWSKIVKQCIEIAKKIMNGDLRETVLKLLK